MMNIKTKCKDDKKEKQHSVIYTIKIESKSARFGIGDFHGLTIEGYGKDLLEAQSNTYPLIKELYETLGAFIIDNDAM